MIKWDLSHAGSGHIDLVAKVDETRLVAGGSSLAPQLCFSFEWQEYSQNNLWDATYRLIAASLELYGPENPSYPLVQTGLIPQSAFPQRPVSLPLSHQLIERISERASRAPDGGLFLNISVTALARTTTRSDTTTAKAPQSTSERLEIYGPSSAQSVQITALQWSKFLEYWGYPAVRFVPVATQLPAQLQISNPVAREHWKNAIDALSTAQQEWRMADAEAAGKQLRQAILCAGLTWDAVWHPGEPSKEKNLRSVLPRIGDHIPEFKQKPYFVDEEAAPDVKRVLGWLILLRDLNTLANPFHHQGVSLVYPVGDIETLLASCTSALRALPKLWEQYPTPESMRTE